MADVMAVLVEQGMLLESARGPIPNVAELVAEEPIRGSWWSHRMSHDISEAINALADSPDVVRLRLVRDKVTLVHSRLWPALARLEDQFPPAALAAIVQEHTASGAHRPTSVPFAEWIPATSAVPLPTSQKWKRWRAFLTMSARQQTPVPSSGLAVRPVARQPPP